MKLQRAETTWDECNCFATDKSTGGRTAGLRIAKQQSRRAIASSVEEDKERWREQRSGARRWRAGNRKTCVCRDKQCRREGGQAEDECVRGEALRIRLERERSRARSGVFQNPSFECTGYVTFLSNSGRGARREYAEVPGRSSSFRNRGMLRQFSLPTSSLNSPGGFPYAVVASIRYLFLSQSNSGIAGFAWRFDRSSFAGHAYVSQQ